MYLLDTNVILELLRPAPDIHVDRYVHGLPPRDVVTSAICEAEIRYGLARLPTSKRLLRLADGVDMFFAQVLSGRVLVFDRPCAEAYGSIRAHCESRGKRVESEDLMIAAVARVHGATLVTRNTKHFAHCGIAVVNPWMPPAPRAPPPRAQNPA